MAKRNLNEVLGFISRWGDSDFSSRLLDEAMSADALDALAKRAAGHSKLRERQLKAKANKRTKDEEKLKAVIADDSATKQDKDKARRILSGLKKPSDVKYSARRTGKTIGDDGKIIIGGQKPKLESDAAIAAKDEAAVENALNASPEPPTKRSFFGKLKDTIGNTIGKLKDTITAKDELSGGITGEEEKPSFKSRMLGKISDVAGRAGETAGMIGAISGIGTTVGQGIIQMNRAQTGKRDVMGASVGGFTKTAMGVGSGLDRLSVGADRLEDEQQIKQAIQKIEAQMKNLRKFQSDPSATEEQKKIAAERYRKLEQARSETRSRNRFHAARMQRMLDLLGTGRTTPTPPKP
jgi:hypothetical protein